MNIVVENLTPVVDCYERFIEVVILHPYTKDEENIAGMYAKM